MPIPDYLCPHWILWYLFLVLGLVGLYPKFPRTRGSSMFLGIDLLCTMEQLAFLWQAQEQKLFSSPLLCWPTVLLKFCALEVMVRSQDWLKNLLLIGPNCFWCGTFIQKDAGRPFGEIWKGSSIQRSREDQTDLMMNNESWLFCYPQVHQHFRSRKANTME